MSSHNGINIVPTAIDHIRSIAGQLRAGDAAELRAVGVPPFKSLWRSYRGSTIAKTAFVDGEIAAIWGLDGSPLKRIGRPWLLTAPPVERVKVSFLRIARTEVAMMLALCPELRGYVDGRYDMALRLLLALGFELSAEFPFGPTGAPFRQYTMRRHRSGSNLINQFKLIDPDPQFVGDE